jgi:hypothetical protein
VPTKLKLDIDDEEIVRITISMPESLAALVDDYLAFNEKRINKKIPKAYLIQQMLQACLDDDKAFQKHLSGKPAESAKAAKTEAPAAGGAAAAAAPAQAPRETGNAGSSDTPPDSALN